MNRNVFEKHKWPKAHGKMLCIIYHQQDENPSKNELSFYTIEDWHTSRRTRAFSDDIDNG